MRLWTNPVPPEGRRAQLAMRIGHPRGGRVPGGRTKAPRRAGRRQIAGADAIDVALDAAVVLDNGRYWASDENDASDAAELMSAACRPVINLNDYLAPFGAELSPRPPRCPPGLSSKWPAAPPPAPLPTPPPPTPPPPRPSGAGGPQQRTSPCPRVHPFVRTSAEGGRQCVAGCGLRVAKVWCRAALSSKGAAAKEQ